MPIKDFNLLEYVVSFNTNKCPYWAHTTPTNLAVLWLNEALCLVSSSMLVDSLVLRNR